MNSTMLSNVVFISSRMSLMTASIVICFKNLTLFSLFRLCIQSAHNGWRRRAMICYLSSKMFSKVVFVFSRMTLMKPPGGDSHFMDLISPECEEEKTSSRLEKQTFRVMARRGSRVCTHFSNGVASRVCLLLHSSICLVMHWWSVPSVAPFRLSVFAPFRPEGLFLRCSVGLYSVLSFCNGTAPSAVVTHRPSYIFVYSVNFYAPSLFFLLAYIPIVNCCLV